jgi:transitional endoplasmic reticulum ATPase
MNMKHKETGNAVEATTSNEVLRDALTALEGNYYTNSEVQAGKFAVKRHKAQSIIIPEAMTSREHAKVALEIDHAESETIGIHESIVAFPFDGAVAFMKALHTVFGWVSPAPTPGFFGDSPPTAVSVDIGPGETMQIFWGRFNVPALHGWLSTNVERKDGMVQFVIGGEVPKSMENKVKYIADVTRAIVQHDSIYKGRPFTMKTQRNGELDYDSPPKFMDVAKAPTEELLFTGTLERQVQTNLFTPIEYTDACRAQGIPLKRGILLEGPYGTGKTMTAYVTARKAQENGWTFIMVDRVSALHEVLKLARLYAPAVVFAEDVDRVISGQDRSVSVDDLLNTIDGIESKHGEIITVLTSNHVENINKAMLRPGRLDAVISVTAPDADTAIRLVRQYARGLIASDVDLAPVGELLGGKIPAVIREAVERAKLYAIHRVGGDMSKMILDVDDLVSSAEYMENHLRLLNDNPDTEVSKQEQLGTLVVELLSSGIEGTLDDLEDNLSDRVAQAVADNV